MKRLMLACAAAALVSGAFAVDGAQARFKGCGHVRYQAMYETITHVRASGPSCVVARAVVHHYLRAITSTISRHGSRTGHCFTHSYGKCTVRVGHRHFPCMRKIQRKGGSSVRCHAHRHLVHSHRVRRKCKRKAHGNHKRFLKCASVKPRVRFHMPN